MKEINVLGYKFSPLVLLAIVLASWFIVANVLFSTMKVSFAETYQNTKEGFQSGWTSVPLFSKAKSMDYITPPSTWNQQPIATVDGVADAGAQAILDRPAQQVPLPAGQLTMFTKTAFKPECCPNTYSKGSGCACMTMGQYDFLKERGGNNVPRSDE